MLSSYHEKFRNFVFEIPRIFIISAIVFSDIILCVLSTWVAFYLRLGLWLPASPLETVYQPLTVALITVSIFLPVSFTLNLYRVLFRYTGRHYYIQLFKACTTLFLALFLTLVVMNFSGVPRTVGIILPFVLFFLLSSSRLVAKKTLDGARNVVFFEKKRHRVIVLGVGESAREIASALEADASKVLIGFVSFDTKLDGTRIFGVPVYHTRDLHNLVASLKINELLCAMPDISLQKYKSLFRDFQNSPVKLRHIPGPGAFLRGEVELGDVAIDITDDLMLREQVSPDKVLLESDTFAKVVLVAGAGGSIGSELCRQILQLKPSKLLVIDHSETAIFELLLNLSQLDNLEKSNCEITPLLGSITDKGFMNVVFQEHKPHTIYNAAAYKHVDLVEKNPIEGLKNNVFGTRNLAELAIKYRANKFVQISTDKAVRPKSVMGASKRVCELFLKYYASKRHPVIFCSVRFGNVMDSSGSVVPIFRDQIKRGGPVTVTDKNATRFFMTIKEAAQLVIQAGAICNEFKEKNDDAPVFLLDMGRPVRIVDLAKRMIEFSGFEPYDEATMTGDIEIQFIGLRKGEKLHEELLISGKTLVTKHPKIMLADEANYSSAELKSFVDEIAVSLKARDFGKLLRSLNSIAGYDA